ncbi:helix-turn-helix domain-containing protein [Actinomadura rudentiformis]|uniref:Helix-turn-helix domain-containing protein n=1 Tax=Actinomadura rudentiformis TaxID=359158 RepID=A0A6H9ZBU3_9ACTN|nr:helix-turn-helix transcriptional regulator [Actinomadura rudentiformis]KAB2351782.1 helix-turn-helix domain-containing protein [Actinomadura rudentiformis]
MPTARASTVRQRRLGVALRRLREEVELSTDDVGWRLGWSASKVSRIETARIGVRESDLKRMLKLYGATERIRGELLALAEAASKKGWWGDYPELRDDQAAYIALEDEADSVLAFESQVVNGLLQTEGYARRLILGWDEVMPRPPAAIERYVQVRLRRQQLIEPPRSLPLTVVLDEAVLLRRVGDNGVMRQQLERLVELAALPNVDLLVLPLDADHGAGLSTFILLEYAPAYEVQFPAMVHIESRTSSQIQDETLAHEYRREFQWLVERSLDAQQSIEFIHRVNAERWAG